LPKGIGGFNLVLLFSIVVMVLLINLNLTLMTILIINNVFTKMCNHIYHNLYIVRGGKTSWIGRISLFDAISRES
jgi:hypothetical protein